MNSRKIMADGETQEFECLNFLNKIVKKVERRVCQMVQRERERERERERDVWEEGAALYWEGR